MKKISWLFGIILLFVGLSACDKDDFESNPGLVDMDLKGASLELDEAGSAFAYGTHVFTSNPKANPDGLDVLNLTKNRWGWAINQNITFNNTITDIDGNDYKTVKIGNQIWMAENLRVTHFNYLTDAGNMIPIQPTEFCIHNIYGGYYRYINVDYIAPEGWRVPTTDDWEQLRNFLLIENNQEPVGHELKEVGNAHWNISAKNTIPATDKYGFTALPAGGARLDPTSSQLIYFQLGEMAYFWTATPFDGLQLYTARLRYENDNLGIGPLYINESNMYSVRCIKNDFSAAIELPIYLGAGLNNTTKGTQVGIAHIEYDGDELKVKYDLFDIYLMNEVHIYASDLQPTTIAPGQYGFTEMFNEPVNEFETIFNIEDAEDDGIWLILHAAIAL